MLYMMQELNVQPKNFQGFPPMGEFVPGPRGKNLGVPLQGGCCAVTGFCDCPCAGAPNPNRCPSAPATQNFARGFPLWENLYPASEKNIGVPPQEGCPAVAGFCGCPCPSALDPDQCPSSRGKYVSRPQPKFFQGSPPRGEGVQGGGSRIPARGRPTINSTHHPQGLKFSQGSPPRGGGVWGLVSCSPRPFAWAPDHSGGSSAAASARTNPSLYLQTEFPPIPVNDPHLPAPLCASPRGDSVGSAAASTLFPVPSPVVPSGVICSVRIYLIVFVVAAIVVVALQISRLHILYHKLPPPNQKIGFVSCFS